MTIAMIFLHPNTIVGNKTSATVAVTNTPLGATTPSTNDNGAPPGDTIRTYSSQPPSPFSLYTHLLLYIHLQHNTNNSSSPQQYSKLHSIPSLYTLSRQLTFLHVTSSSTYPRIELNRIESPRQKKAQKNWQRNSLSRVEKNWYSRHTPSPPFSSQKAP